LTLLLFFTAGTATASHADPIVKAQPLAQPSLQQIPISGTVVDQNGDPIPGATILIEGSITGTATNIHGDFSLDVSEGTILIVSFIEYEHHRITVGSQAVFDIVLKEDLSSLEEVVVVGYGTVKKSDLTGSVSSIKGESIREFPVTSIDQAVQGRAAGVQVTQASPAPGGGVAGRVRG